MDLKTVYQQNQIEVNYGLALVAMLVFSTYRRHPQSISFIFACIILYLAYGIHNTAYLLAAVSFNLFLLRLDIGFLNEYYFIVINIIILYFYKIFGRRIEPNIQGTFDISGFLMLLIVKSSYLRSEYGKKQYEQSGTHGRGEEAKEEAGDNNRSKGGINSAEKESRDDRVVETKSLSDALEYLLFIPGLLSGPTPTYAEFVSADRKAPSSFPWKRFIKALAFLGIYMAFRSYPFKKAIVDPGASLLRRLLFLYLYNFVLRNKFHFIWNYADTCFILHNFHNLLNIEFRKVELCESVREISANWNKFVSRWLKHFFFIPLRRKSTNAAVIGTYVASACFHGINCCYLIFFLSFGLFSGVITRVNQSIPYRFLRRLQMVLFVSFFSMPFYLLDLNETYQIWKAVYFVGVVYCVALAAFFLIYDTAFRLFKPLSGQMHMH